MMPIVSIRDMFHQDTGLSNPPATARSASPRRMARKPRPIAFAPLSAVPAKYVLGPRSL